MPDVGKFSSLVTLFFGDGLPSLHDDVIMTQADCK